MAIHNRGHFQFSTWLPVYYATLSVILPLNILLSLLVSIIVHELSHLLAMKICAIPIDSIEIGMFGMKIVAQPMNSLQEFICSFAGPFGGLLVAFLFDGFPILSMCAFAHSLYNLLPIYPLDGGRVLHSLLGWLFSAKTTAKILRIVAWITVCGLFILCMVLAFKLKTGAFILFSLFVVFAVKIPCKETLVGVQ